MAWNDALSQTTDIFATAFVGQYWSARYEREAALGGSPAGTLPATGCLPAAATASAPASTTGKFSVTNLQGWLETNCVNFVNNTLTLDGSALAETSWNFTLASWRSAAGINSAGFRRLRPRSITSTAAVADTDGNARASGQKAWDLATGTLVTFNGTAWVAATLPALPDTLDSNSAAPNTVPYGAFAVGDYYWHGLFAELRAGFNRLLWTRHLAAFTNYDTRHGDSALGSPHATFASAQSAAETDWAPDVTGGATTPALLTAAEARRTNATNYTGVLDAARAFVSANSIAAGVSKTAEFYVFTTLATPGSEWDANGDDVLQDQWSLTDSKTVAAAGSPANVTSNVRAGHAASLSVKPPWPAAGVPATNLTSFFRGYTITKGQILLKHDFVYQ